MVEKIWFRDCVESGVRVHQHMGEQFVIYKGFKVIEKGGKYTALDVRKGDFYSPISKGDVLVFDRHGFVKGVNLISHTRNKRRVSLYTNLIDRLRRDLATYQSSLMESSLKAFYIKKVRNAELKIDKSVTLLALYKTKVTQYMLNN